MDRIVILGHQGSGKTTLAFQIAAKKSIPSILLDELFWEAGSTWSRRPRKDFIEKVKQVASPKQQWVTDGNYGEVRTALLRRADTAVWLDYSLPLILRRLTQRTIKRLRTQESICNGKVEKLGNMFTRNNIYYLLYNIPIRRVKQFIRGYLKILRHFLTLTK